MEAPLGDASVHLQRPHRTHQHDGVGPQAGLPAFDVQELLRAQIGAESGLGDHDVAQRQRRFRGHHRVAAVGDVGERPAVDERRIAFEALHKIRLQGIAEQRCQRTFGAQIASRDRRTAMRASDHDARQALLQISSIAG